MVLEVKDLFGVVDKQFWRLLEIWFVFSDVIEGRLHCGFKALEVERETIV